MVGREQRWVAHGGLHCISVAWQSLIYAATPCMYFLFHAVICSCSCPLQAMPTQDATRQWSTDEVTTAVAFAQDVESDMLSFVPAAEGSDSNQSWPGLFWLPPAADGRDSRDMLRLDDELAGLIEAADPSADQPESHTAKPESPPTAPGETFSRDKTQVSCCIVGHVVGCVKLHCNTLLPALLCPHLMTCISCPGVSCHCCPSQGVLR